jgi:Spherulation-specific family 4/IPT/TIG domain
LNTVGAGNRYRRATRTPGARLAISIALVLLTVLVLATEAVGVAQPTVSAVWPRTGRVAGGTPLTVVGSGFSAGSLSVRVDGISATGVSVVSDTVLKVTAPSLPNGATPTGTVAVSTSQGTSASTSPLATYTYRGGLSLAVPAYFYALTSSWVTLDGPPRTADLAVLNPASGSGSSIDPNYVQQVAASQAAGVDIVGYVDTSYGRRSLSTVEADITRYEQWYHVNGIFVDQVATDCATEASYYAPLYAFIHAQPGLDLTVVNPGAPAPSCYMAASEIIMTFEGTPANLASGASTV